MISVLEKDGYFRGYQYNTDKATYMLLNKPIKVIPATEDYLAWRGVLPDYFGNVDGDSLLPAALYCRSDIPEGKYSDGNTYIKKGKFVYRHGPFSFNTGKYIVDGHYAYGLPTNIRIYHISFSYGVTIKYDEHGYKQLIKEYQIKYDKPGDLSLEKLFSSIPIREVSIKGHALMVDKRGSDILKIPLEKRYLSYLPYCNGIKTIPKTYQEFKEDVKNTNSDYWDAQIACVLWGGKIAAITTYMDVSIDEDPYTTGPDIYFDRELHRLVDKSNLRVLKRAGEYGHYVYYKVGDEANAKLIDEAFASSKVIPKYLDADIVRSLALGYTPTSIIMYKVNILLTQNDTEEKYQQLVKETIDEMIPKIKEAISYLKSINAKYNGDTLIA